MIGRPTIAVVVAALGACGSTTTDDDAMVDPEPPPSCPTSNTGPGTAPEGTVPGALTFPHPTLRNATILWEMSGDQNANSVVTVRYRKQGAAGWRRGLPLRRVPANAVEGIAWTDRHAGSVFDLDPETTYEVELFLLDPDGGCELRTGTVTTRAIPAPMVGATIKPATPASLATVLQGAVASDVIELGAGTYAGFTVTADGSATAPIVLRAAAGAAVTVNGEVNLTNRTYVHVDGLTINGLVRLNYSVGVAITGNVVNAMGPSGFGIDAHERSEDSYIADNIVTGTTTWAEASLGVSGNNLGDGIAVNGPGHVVEHNRVSGFRDCLSTSAAGSGGVDQFSIDFIENDLDTCGDDGIEADYCVHNCRVMRNRFTNVFVLASSQPGLGGPTYFIRNAGYNVIYAAFKLHNGTIGEVILHNTVVKNGNAFNVNASVTFARQYTRNNVFIGGPGGTYNGYGTGDGQVIYLPYADPSGDYNFDGLGSTTGTFMGRIGSSTFSSLSELRANTTEAHAVEVDLAIFGQTVAYPASPFPRSGPVDLRLAPATAATDAGEMLPNVTDGFVGEAPDLGAYELGVDLPAYGPR